MCLIAFAFTPGQPRHLLLAANRDEFHDRPARPMSWWSWPNGPLAGRDERAGGTWLALARDGRWSAVTNFRDPRAPAGRQSRGELPVRFLQSGSRPADYAHAIHAERRQFGAFNLLVGDINQLWYCSTHQEPTCVSSGVHALSNGLLDEPWPKTRRVSLALKALTNDQLPIDPQRLCSLMDDREPADDNELPETGIGIEHERALSPPFIVSPAYGTRCTTVVELGSACRVLERSFDPAGTIARDIEYHFAATNA